MLKKLVSTILTSVLVVGLVSGCAQSSSESASKEVKIGYFPNLTHSSTIIAA